MKSSASVELYSQQLLALQASSRFTIFLCGPALREKSPAARLRKQLQETLTNESYDVVLGEDDGLNNSRFKIGLNAQDQELEFISDSCNAVVIIAASPGSLCELGLFSWHFVNPKGKIRSKHETLFVVILDKKFKGKKSYINEGPLRSLFTFGQVFYADFKKFRPSKLLDQLQQRRSLHTIRRRRAPK